MPHWYWEKRELRLTPSQNKGLEYETEVKYRREGARFIIELGKAMGLSHNTMASGAVYFHRFYMCHAFQDFPRYVVSTCCLFLAGKAEETPKKCRNIIEKVQKLVTPENFATFGQDPREEVMVTERVLLQTLKFDLQVDHPYSCLISYAKCLKGDQQKLQKMVQMSWTFVNDSLCTMLCLQWEPEIIAIALMYLAAKLSKFEVKDWQERREHHKHWWDQYVEDLDIDLIEDICHHVLDLYAQTGENSHAPSPQPNAAIQNKPSSAPGSRKNTPPPPPAGAVAAAAAATPQPPQPKSRPHTPPPPLPPSGPMPPMPSAASSAGPAPPPPPPQQQQQAQAVASGLPFGYAPPPPPAVGGVPPQAYHQHHFPPPGGLQPPVGGPPPPPPQQGGQQPGGYYGQPPMLPQPGGGGHGGYHRGHHGGGGRY